MEVLVTVLPPSQWSDHARFRLERGIKLEGVLVRQGFITDGASISRWITLGGLVVIAGGIVVNSTLLQVFGGLIALIPVVFPKTNNYFPATIIHDYLLAEGERSRKECDMVFKKCLITLGVRRWRVFCMYCAVRLYSIIKGVI